MNDNKELIDRGTYYEIKDYEPVVNRDENGNVVSVIHRSNIDSRTTPE